MNNKILIKLIFPELNDTFDIFIPANEIIWKIKKMLLKCVGELSNTNIDMNAKYILLNKDNSRIYKNNDLVIETDIRNCTELVMISQS